MFNDYWALCCSIARLYCVCVYLNMTDASSIFFVTILLDFGDGSFAVFVGCMTAVTLNSPVHKNVYKSFIYWQTVLYIPLVFYINIFFPSMCFCEPVLCVFEALQYYKNKFNVNHCECAIHGVLSLIEILNLDILTQGLKCSVIGCVLVVWM